MDCGLHVGPHLVVHPGGGAAQGQLPQGHQVAGPEELLHGLGGLLGDVDLALLQPLQQVFRGDIDQLDLDGLVQQAVGHGLPHDDAGDLGHHVVQALEMLDVDRGVDVDAGGQQLLHILPALLVARAGGVGVGQFVHQGDLRLAGQDRVEIHLRQRHPLVDDLPCGMISSPSSRASVSGRPWDST